MSKSIDEITSDVRLPKDDRFYNIITAFHKYLDDRADSYLRDHSEKLCPVCVKEKASGNGKQKPKKSPQVNGNVDNSEKSDIFGKIG